MTNLITCCRTKLILVFAILCTSCTVAQNTQVENEIDLPETVYWSNASDIGLSVSVSDHFVREGDELVLSLRVYNADIRDTLYVLEDLGEYHSSGRDGLNQIIIDAGGMFEATHDMPVALRVVPPLQSFDLTEEIDLTHSVWSSFDEIIPIAITFGYVASRSSLDYYANLSELSVLDDQTRGGYVIASSMVVDAALTRIDVSQFQVFKVRE